VKSSVQDSEQVGKTFFFLMLEDGLPGPRGCGNRYVLQRYLYVAVDLGPLAVQTGSLQGGDIFGDWGDEAAGSPHTWVTVLGYQWSECTSGCVMEEVQIADFLGDNVQLLTVPEFIDPSFRENKPKTLVFSHTKRAYWACFRENCVYNFGHRFSRKQAQYACFHLIENERFGWFS
jgi:hypothetical protein